MTSFFWWLAYRLYARRKPSTLFELFAIGGVGTIALLYAVAVFINPTQANAVRLVVAMLIVVVGFAHRRVRLERLKGPQALYAKAVADAIIDGRANATNEVVQAVSAEGDEFVEVSENA